MTNYNKLHSFDEESIKILESVPKQKRSEFVREGVKLLHTTKLNENTPKETPKPQVRFLS